MRRNKTICLKIVMPAFVFAFLIWGSFHFYWFYYRTIPWGSDLLFRYNEITCSHEGIDPFDVFDRKVSSEKYYGIDRPDKPKEERNGRKPVHAYPAWHTAVFWWYGYVPQSICYAFITFLYTCSLIWVCIWVSKHIHEKDKLYCTADILFLLCMFAYPFSGICCFMNYGLFLAGCAFLLFMLLERQNEVLAGIVFSLIMLKPQIGIPLLIPLFVNKNFKTVFIAGVICILETLFTAWKLDKSPVELILQIPQIGAPFSHVDYFGMIATKLFGTLGPFFSKALFLAIALAGSFFVRNAKDIWVRFLPSVAIIPFWVYSQSHDWIILLPCYLYILNGRQKHPRLYELSFCLLCLWGVFTSCHLLEWYFIGKRGLASVLLFVILSISCFMAIIDLKDNWDLDFLKFRHRDPNKTQDNG